MKEAGNGVSLLCHVRDGRTGFDFQNKLVLRKGDPYPAALDIVDFLEVLFEGRQPAGLQCLLERGVERQGELTEVLANGPGANCEKR